MKLKFFSIQYSVFFGLSTFLYAGELQSFSITTNQAIAIEQQIAAYEKGRITIHDLNEKATTEKNREIVGYYLLHTNDLSVKVKLAVGRSYWFFGLYSDAVRLTTEYLNVYSNDFHAWNVLGTSYLYLKSYDQAMAAYTNAVRLGDNASYIPLAWAAIQNGHWSVVENILPELIELEKSSSLSFDNRLDLDAILLTYSIQFEKEDIFVKALDGVSAKQILSRQDLTKLVTYGCQMFKGKRIDHIRQEVEAAQAMDSSLSTNTPSP